MVQFRTIFLNSASGPETVSLSTTISILRKVGNFSCQILTPLKISITFHMYRSAVCFFFFKLDIYVVDFPGVGSFFVPRRT